MCLARLRIAAERGRLMLQPMERVMFKELLVHVKPYEDWSAHIDLAIALGARFDAQVTGVMAHENLAIAKLLAGAPNGGGELIADLQAAADLQTATMQGRFMAALQAANVRGAFHAAEGRAHDVLTLAGRFFDLLIVEKTNFNEDSANWSSAEEAAVGSGRPTLIAPRDVSSDGAFRRVLLAWNGGCESTRALHASRPILERADEVIVLQGRPREFASSVTKPPPGDIETYLRRHVSKVTVANSDVKDADAAEQILDVASAAKCDLIVMGAYGRRGISRLILGSATGRVFRDARIPILAAH